MTNLIGEAGRDCACFINFYVTRARSMPCKASWCKFNLSRQPCLCIFQMWPRESVSQPISQQSTACQKHHGNGRITESEDVGLTPPGLQHLRFHSYFRAPLQLKDFPLSFFRMSPWEYLGPQEVFFVLFCSGFGGMGNTSMPIQHRMRSSLAEQLRLWSWIWVPTLAPSSLCVFTQSS